MLYILIHKNLIFRQNIFASLLILKLDEGGGVGQEGGEGIKKLELKNKLINTGANIY